MKTRSIVVMVFLIAVGFTVVAGRLLYLQTVMAEELQQRANDQQLVDTSITAKRGNIYDANGTLLAQSITTWDIVIEPNNLQTDKARNMVAEGLSVILNVDREKIKKKTEHENFYEVIKTKIDADTKDQVVAFRNYLRDEYGMSNVIDINENYKRHYTYDNFAADVIGFVNNNQDGAAGVEYQYNDILKGTNGRQVVARDVNGHEMPYAYEQKIEAENGYNLTLTIDENIQNVLEKYVRETITEFNVGNRGCAIMMNVKTGAILGFACEGSFNPNDPYTVADEEIRKEIDTLPAAEQGQAEYNALQNQWRNKGVSDTYIPGSVFKMVTASAVLSESMIDKTTRFECTGSYVPFEGSSPITCWLGYPGHGTQTLEEALCNSCNPAFMQMGFMLGRERFYEYYVAFGMSEPTGIDLPGESSDYFFHHEDTDNGMTLTDLAVASFGQNFKITPMQMITACSAIANGGKLMTPYVVAQISDANGNVVKTTEPTVRRQAISKEVADTVLAMLERNVKSGGGTNGYIPGYRIGGKTGTSQKIVDETGVATNDYIASFCGIAPCDDPEIALLCYFDTPDPSVGYYGSQVAGPCFRNIMSEVLPYLGIEKQYSDDEITRLDTTTQAYVGLSVDEARAMISSDKLNVLVVGEGEIVLEQNPAAYVTIPKDGTVVLYTEENPEKKKVVVPDFTGKSISEANSLAAEHNLNLCIGGSVSSAADSYAKSQDIPAGTEADPYTVITVTFNQNNSIM